MVNLKTHHFFCDLQRGLPVFSFSSSVIQNFSWETVAALLRSRLCQRRWRCRGQRLRRHRERLKLQCNPDIAWTGFQSRRLKYPELTFEHYLGLSRLTMAECRHKIQILEFERNPRHSNPNRRHPKTLGLGPRRCLRLKGVVGLIPDQRAQVSRLTILKIFSNCLIRTKIRGSRTDHELP